MTRGMYIRRRLLLMLPTAFGVTLITFFMIHLIPGDPAVTMLGIRATPKAVALLRNEWGLNRPLYEQYWLFLSRIVRGNFGTSLFYGSSATGLILRASLVTFELIVYAVILSIVIAVPLAVLAATHRNRVADQAVRAIPLIGMGMPSAWIAIMLILLLGLKSHVFPVAGLQAGFVGHLDSMFLPSLTLSLGIAPLLIRSLRSSLIDAFDADFVTTARSKGIREYRVLIRHAIRNSLASSLNILGLQIAFLISGTLVVESVFALPGVGALMVNSIFRRDFPVVQGITFLLAVAVILTNLGTDIIHSIVDPRVRFE
ncbi:MAG TPA: ABC transporter permease [Acidimicrobiales bacterium]